jgi:hypothetical protein
MGVNMSKLLSAGFARMWKNTMFWLEIIIMALLFAAIMIADYQSARDYGNAYSLDTFFSGPFVVIGFFTASFASMFLGTEYSDGTIRNKLSTGHSRGTVYLSGLILCFAATLLFCLSAIAIICIMGIPLFGFLVNPLADTSAVIVIGIFTAAAYSAIFTLVSMSVTNKPITVMVCIFLCIAFYFSSVRIEAKLGEPEINPGYAWLENGVPVSSRPTPNPNYISGAKRECYEFIYDFLPSGQSIQLGKKTPNLSVLFPLYSLFITVSSTAGGILIFRKRDLK